MSELQNLFNGIGAGLAVLVCGWIYANHRRNVAVRAHEIDRTQAKDKKDRELLETIYSAMVTAPPTAFNPNPNPGLIETVRVNTRKLDGIEGRLEQLEAKVGDVGDKVGHDRMFSGEIAGTHIEGVVSPQTDEHA